LKEIMGIEKKERKRQQGEKGDINRQREKR
jgi:hypothetical protein